MRFTFPDMFAPMVATLLVCAVIAVVGIVVGFIGVRTGPPTEQGLRAMLSTLGTILLAVVTAAILNPVLGNMQLGKLESEQRAWVKNEYNIELDDSQFSALRFPGMDPGPGTVVFGEAEVTQWGKPVTVKLVSEDGLFSVLGSNDLPLPTEAPASDTPAPEEP